MNRPIAIRFLMATALAGFAAAIAFTPTAHADGDDDGDEADVEITYVAEAEGDLDAEPWPDDSGGGDPGGGSCGECTPGELRCWDNWSDQICGTDGNGCGTWYYNSTCEDPYICNYSHCGD
jgi:hypothetical protein